MTEQNNRGAAIPAWNKLISPPGVQHVTPSDAVAHVAGLLMREPSTYIPALAAAMRAVKGPGPAAVVADCIMKEVNK